MTISRRLALGYASAFAVASGASDASARTLRTVLDTRDAAAAPQTAQRISHLLLHRDEAGGTPRFATLSIRATDTAWMAIHTLDDTAYRQAADTYGRRGYRLRRVNAFQTKNGMRYAAVWQLGAGPASQARHNMTLAQFEETSTRLASRGHRLAHIDGSATKSGARYAAIWERGAGAPQQSFAALNAADYERKLAALTAQGFRPVQISGYASGGQVLYAAIFEKSAGPAWEMHRVMTASAFQTKSNAMAAQGHLLMDASGAMLNGQAIFSGVWEKA
jgi:hypothetical protein